MAGVGGYGNCLGLPNIGGELVFDPSYYGNPLVNALCVGVLRHEDMHLAFASGTGNAVILYGAATGGDGIGGASILASETFEADGPAKRPACLLYTSRVRTLRRAGTRPSAANRHCSTPERCGASTPGRGTAS